MKKSFYKIAFVCAVISLCTVNIAIAAGGSIGVGDISVYKNGALVTKLSGQNPIENGALLICTSRCMIKSEGISLLGEGLSQVAVKSEDDTFKIYLKAGKVDFIINNNVRKISFHTPDGTYTVADVVFNAASGSVVKGSVMVDDVGNTEITVTEGRMVFATAEGMKTVDANSKIVLAVLPPGAPEKSMNPTGMDYFIGTLAVVSIPIIPQIQGGGSSIPAQIPPGQPVEPGVPPVTPPISPSPNM